MVIGLKNYFGGGRLPQQPKPTEPAITIARDGLLDLPGHYRAHVRVGDQITLSAEAAELAEQLGWCVRMTGGPPRIQTR